MAYWSSKNNEGYTVVETLVALAILMAVLIPLSGLLARLLNAEKTRDLIVATQLARQEMERTITFQIYQTEENRLLLNNKKWRIRRQTRYEDGLVEITVRVYKGSAVQPTVELKTLRVSYAERP